MFNKGFLLAIVTLIFSAFTWAQGTPEISQQELQQLINSNDVNYVLLDVRSEQEYQDSHIPTAINLSHNLVADNIASLAQHKDKIVIVYCRSGRRAGIAEAILRDNGFTNLRHLTGDMNGWHDAKLPTVSN